ncbi:MULTISPECIES: hypothetical protein [Marinomonas]|uniref:Response regulatory domain-containing protein n=1 Tax=Marinomonas rhodophyticola TaxID=2992803 RepID=A0ABT3KBX7_9GAMM|nr:hypothetical protein [Marinomonas sp. KJ51-3]MCW4628048.1 hypothetical protein [Marinomonas sp. KJ51-3]
MENHNTDQQIEIWLLDDDDIVRSTTAQWLRLSDYVVKEFHHAQEAHQQVQYRLTLHHCQ